MRDESREEVAESAQDVKLGSRDCCVLFILGATTARRNFGRRNAMQLTQLNFLEQVRQPCDYTMHNCRCFASQKNSQNKKFSITRTTAIFL